MYIIEINIENIKLIHKLKIDFRRGGGEPRMWTVLVGRNGLCKTSILQAIAIAASGADRANQLAEATSFPDRRSPELPTSVNALFRFGDIRHPVRQYPLFNKFESPPFLYSAVVIPPKWKLFRSFSNMIPSTSEPQLEYVGDRTVGIRTDFKPDGLQTARAEGLPYWFVTGYGVVRNLPYPKTSERSEDPVRDRLETLFGKGRLTGTGFIDLFDDTKLALAYSKTLKTALLNHKDMIPGIADLELRGKGGVTSAKELLESHRIEMQAGKKTVKIPVTWLSHGYQATISWIADLIGQMFWEAGKPVKLEDMEGLVLIDEIDLHLHPLWQVGLISALKAAFPRVQFIATTHSPMMLTGLEADEIIILDQDNEGNIKVVEPNRSPDLMTGSELLDVFFGIDKLYPVQTGEDLQRYGYLSTNAGRSDTEDAEMKRILARLKAAGVEPGWEPKPRRKRK